MGRSALSCCALPPCSGQEPNIHRSLGSCAIATTSPGPPGASKEVLDFCAFAKDRFQGRLSDSLVDLGPQDSSPVKRQAFLQHAAQLGYCGDAGRVFDALDTGGYGVLSIAELRSQLTCAAGAATGRRRSPRKSGSSPRKGPSPRRRGSAPGSGVVAGRGKKRASSPEVPLLDAASVEAQDAASLAKVSDGTASAPAGQKLSLESAGGPGAGAGTKLGGDERGTKSQAQPPPAAGSAASTAAPGPSMERERSTSPQASPGRGEPRSGTPGMMEAPASPPPVEPVKAALPEAGAGEASTDTAELAQRAPEATPEPTALPPRRASLASVGSAWEALLPVLGPPRVSGKGDPFMVVGPVAGPEDEDGFPMVDTEDFVQLRPLPYIPVHPEDEDDDRQRSFVHQGRVVTVPMLPLHRLQGSQEEVRLPRGSNWGMVKSKVMGGAGGTVNEAKSKSNKQ